jgi:hypothetical protein
MRITVELSDAQAGVFNTLGVDTVKSQQTFAVAAINNKLKSTVMNSLKTQVINGEDIYKKLPPAMKATMDSGTFISTMATIFYNAAQSLGGRTMKPLDEIVRDILSGDSAIEE